MDILSHLKQLTCNLKVNQFLEKYKECNPIFGINYKNQNRVSFKLYGELKNIEELKSFNFTLYKKIEEFIPLMADLPFKRRFHVALKCKNNKIVEYFHFKFKNDVFFFSVPYPECSYQGMSIEEDIIRPYFYYENNSKLIKSDFNILQNVNHIEFAQTKDYKKINLGTKDHPYNNFLNLDRLALDDSIILKKFFNQEIITTGKYNDIPTPTVAIYYYDCFKDLLKIN